MVQKTGLLSCWPGCTMRNPVSKSFPSPATLDINRPISGGLAYTTGNTVGVMDADLQDPPEIFGDCLQKLHEGFDVVYAVRRKRKESLPKRIAYNLFYRLFRFMAESEMPLDSGDFCLMSRRVVEQLKKNARVQCSHARVARVGGFSTDRFGV